MVNVTDDTEQIYIAISQPGQFEDLSTYTLVPGAYLSLFTQPGSATANGVNFINLPTNVQPPCYLQSMSRVLTDFDLRYHLHVTELQDNPAGGQGTSYLGGAVYCLMTRRVGIVTVQDIMAANGAGNVGDGMMMGIRSYWGGTEANPKHIFAVYNYDNTIYGNVPPGTERYEFVYWRGAPNTSPELDIYVKLVKIGSTATLWLYSDAAMTQLLPDALGNPFPATGGNISIPSISPYAYFVACAIRETTTAYTTTGYKENFQFL